MKRKRRTVRMFSSYTRRLPELIVLPTINLSQGWKWMIHLDDHCYAWLNRHSGERWWEQVIRLGWLIGAVGVLLSAPFLIAVFTTGADLFVASFIGRFEASQTVVAYSVVEVTGNRLLLATAIGVVFTFLGWTVVRVAARYLRGKKRKHINGSVVWM